MLYNFKNLPKDKYEVGGKAYMLAMMSQLGLNVPKGIILDSTPTQQEFAQLCNTLATGEFSLAVRSSASGEDSKENSFAGQNSTFLYVSTEEDLKTAINNCFNSIHKESSKAYRKHFLGSGEAVPMNVVIQDMIDPVFSGVYFSKDPRGKYKTWMIEYIDGVGEDLVSGKRTPQTLSEENQNSKDITPAQVSSLLEAVRKVEEEYTDDFDIEWAIGQDGQMYILQARPITAKNSISRLKEIGDEELKRLEALHESDVIWDGQTFAEWTVCPTKISSELWSRSFEPEQSFDRALKFLGYKGFSNKTDKSLLNEVFGRNYINLNRLGELYFGPIPYSITSHPRPHLKFNFAKISAKVILSTPKTLFRMLKVGLSINTERRKAIEQATKELMSVSTKLKRPNDPSFYSEWSDEKLKERLEKEVYLFHKKTLKWPYILISLTETTIQTLLSLLESIMPKDEANDMIKKWSGMGINSETFEMGQYFKKACAKPELRGMFLERYGHRGPGELDLSTKRWIEIGDDSFYDLSIEDYQKSKKNHSFFDVDEEIDSMKTFKKSIVLQEWHILKELLELREKWKMFLLKPYCHIRFILLELSKRLGLESIDDIFWLSVEEATNFKKEYTALIAKRKLEAKQFKNFNFSTVTSLTEIKEVLSGKSDSTSGLNGEGIATGLVKGEVVVINSPENWKNIKWPQNPIVVAQSTDPGWTPIFSKASGIIVERGGVLSHCAIVAREMGIPAVSGINQCHIKFKGGENVWIDGNTGTVKLV